MTRKIAMITLLVYVMWFLLLFFATPNKPILEIAGIAFLFTAGIYMYIGSICLLFYSTNETSKKRYEIIKRYKGIKKAHEKNPGK